MIFPDTLIGHENIYNELIFLYKKDSLPSKILLTGKKGIGKSLLVNKFLTHILNDKNENNDIYKLIKTNSHPNVYKIKKNNEKKNIDIDQIREMLKFQNHSSFNNKEKFVVIEDVENLNINSSNALLKSIEEPNNNLFFFLINSSGHKISNTLKSRCLEFKMSLSLEEIKSIVNNYFQEDIYDKISNDFINDYNSPSFLISLIVYLRELEKDISTFKIEDFLHEIIKNKLYMNSDFLKENLNIFIELFFYKNIRNTKNISYKIKNYFYFKFSRIKRYNLDLEPFFIEFEDKLLSE
mgnify:CR=1 FL=1